MSQVKHPSQFNPFHLARAEMKRIGRVPEEDREGVLMAAAILENFPYEPFDILEISQKWLPVVNALWSRPPGLRDPVIREHLDGGDFGPAYTDAVQGARASFRSWRSFRPWDAPAGH